MSDNPPPEPATPAEAAGTPTTVTKVSGGVNLDAQRDVNIGGDVVGRDKVTSNTVFHTITNIFQGDAAQRDLRNRRNMLERVKNDWVKGVLEKSLYHEVMLDLGLEERPDEVQHPWDMTLQMPEHENRALPPSTKIMQVFDEANHALLILGEPGSGKTTMLLELARDTIARAEQDPTQPIPVVFNLSSWADSKQTIADWLVQELRDKYNVSKKIAQPWVNNDDLLLLLDGLDEVKAEQREACVRAINYFRNEHGQTALVVCSRIADYEALTAQLKLRGAVFIHPLTWQEIGEYLDRIGSELTAMRESLQRDTDLQELMQSPLMLGIMTLTYRGMSSAATADKSSDSIEIRRKRLFDAYTQQMFERVVRTKNAIYDREQIMHWLTRLAQRMAENRQAVFLLDQMLDWLQTRQQWRLYRLIVGLIYGLIYMLIWGLVGGLYGGPIGALFGGLVGALVGGLVGGLLIRLYAPGGVISRFASRFILSLNGDIPWNYVRFLDYATERVFLRKVGGGYIFIHRMLMEYFASLEIEPSARKK
jgi:hypothetical protein